MHERTYIHISILLSTFLFAASVLVYTHTTHMSNLFCVFKSIPLWFENHVDADAHCAHDASVTYSCCMHAYKQLQLFLYMSIRAIYVQRQPAFEMLGNSAHAYIPSDHIRANRKYNHYYTFASKCFSGTRISMKPRTSMV